MTRVVDREWGCRREGVEVLMEGVRCNRLVVGGYEVVKLDGEEV